MELILFYIALPLIMISCDTEKRIKPIGPTCGYVLAKMNGESWIRINKRVDSYNPKSKEIKGSFQVTFVLERAGYGHILPDTMRFTDGRFFTKMMDLSRK